jgi:hypothetical protein
MNRPKSTEGVAPSRGPGPLDTHGTKSCMDRSRTDEGFSISADLPYVSIEPRPSAVLRRATRTHASTKVGPTPYKGLSLHGGKSYGGYSTYNRCPSHFVVKIADGVASALATLYSFPIDNPCTFLPMPFEREPLSYLHARRVSLSKSEGWIEAAYGRPTLSME